MTEQTGKGSSKTRQASGAGKKGSSENAGNFKNNPQRAAEAGRKGGQNSHGGGNKS